MENSSSWEFIVNLSSLHPQSDYFYQLQLLSDEQNETNRRLVWIKYPPYILRPRKVQETYGFFSVHTHIKDHHPIFLHLFPIGFFIRTGIVGYTSFSGHVTQLKRIDFQVVLTEVLNSYVQNYRDPPGSWIVDV